MATPQKPNPPPPKTNGQVVAQVFVDALSDPDWEKKEAAAQAEREARMREALKKQGRLPKD